jgi:hypothetical protein
VARNIGEKQPADAPRSATGDVVDVTAALGLAKRLAIDPDIETGQFDSTRCELATSPDLHALHVLRRGIRHASIIRADRPSLSRLGEYSRASSFGGRLCNSAKFKESR